ncbi:MAG: LamG domain-containing protein, partial [Candidatus Omnitrophica bacterium]|nr:LamG domain-containing protein [Candidatus Omnitrophota bacterium]
MNRRHYFLGGKAKKKIFSFLVIASLVCFSSFLFPEQQGEFFREDTNLPTLSVEPTRIGNLIFWLQSDFGVKTDASGIVTSWLDSSQKLVFTALSPTEKPLKLIPAAIGDFPAVKFTACQHRPPGVLSQPVPIKPEQGLTLVILARVTEPVGIGFLLGYGAQYKTEGSLTMWLSGSASYQRTVLTTNLGADSPPLSSSAGNIFGKGFSLMAVRYDPMNQTVTLFENGLVVGQAKRSEPLASSFPFAVGVETRRTWSFSGEVLTALAYNRALTEEEIAGLQTYFWSRYGLGSKKISLLANQLPFAYYPSRNQMEVAVELTPELKEKAGLKPEESLKEVIVRVIALAGGKLMATGRVQLDKSGRGQEVFAVPDFPDGQYAVEYEIGQYHYRSPKTFKRIHFPFEQTN